MASADVESGPISSYGLTGGVPVTIQPTIDLLDAEDLPLQNGYSFAGNVVVPALPRGDVGNRRYEWQDDTLLESLSLLDGALGDTTGTAVPVDDASRFKVGDNVRVDTEQMLVTAVNPATDTLTVTRGFAGSTAATHADNARIYGLGQALVEGSEAVLASHIDRTRRFNVTTIMGPREIRVTGTETIMPKYGLAVGGEFSYQIAKESLELAKMFERGIIYSLRFEDTAAERRTMGGLDWHIQTNVDSSTTALTFAAISAQYQAIWEAGGNSGGTYSLLLNLTNKMVLSALDEDQVRLGRQDSGRGQVVEFLDTDVGRVILQVSRYVEEANAYLYVRDALRLLNARPWQMRPLSVGGDYERVMIVGEFGFQAKRERHLAKFTGLTNP